MAIGIDQVFNSTGEVGSWISNSTTNVTGNLFLTVMIMLMFILLMLMLFKMPELLMALILAPLLIVFATITEIGQPMQLIVGAVIIMIGLGLYAFYPSK